MRVQTPAQAKGRDQPSYSNVSGLSYVSFRDVRMGTYSVGDGFRGREDYGGNGSCTDD